MDDLVRIEADGHIQTIRFDRPEEQNALTGVMYDAAADALVLGEADPKVRVFIIAGTPGAFTAGSDASEFRDYARTGAVTPTSVRFLKTLATVEKPIVAAVDGLAIGSGTTMLLHCDYVVASEWSVFAVPYVAMGLPPEAASTLLAPRLIGIHLAFELLVMGESFDARRALEIGLVNRVVPPEAVEDTAVDAARLIAMKPPEAVRMARLLMRGDSRDVVARITAEAGGFQNLQRSREASDAFAEYLARQPERGPA